MYSNKNPAVLDIIETGLYYVAWHIMSDEVIMVNIYPDLFNQLY